MRSVSKGSVVLYLGAQFRLQETAANGGAYIKNLEVELGPSLSTIIYENEFADAAGTVASNASAYLFRLNPTPLTDDLGLSAVRAKIVMRAPTNDWVGHENADRLEALSYVTEQPWKAESVIPSPLFHSGWTCGKGPRRVPSTG